MHGDDTLAWIAGRGIPAGDFDTMKYSDIHIGGIGYELAPVVVTSDDIEDRLASLYAKLKIQPGQLEAWTGIQERRWWPEGVTVVEGARAATRKVLDMTGIDPKQIGALVYTGVCRRFFEPATACHVAADFKLNPNALIYDISNACLGIINGITDIANRIQLGQIQAGIAVSCESARDITDIMIQKILTTGTMDFFRYSLATLTGGSGAAAVLVTSASLQPDNRRRIIAAVNQSAPQHHWLCRWGMEPTGNGHEAIQFMETDSVAVLRNGVNLGLQTWNAFCLATDWTNEIIDRTISHQVGSAHRDTVLKLLNIDPAKDFPTYPFLGNMGTVSLPITAAIAQERGFLQPGHKTGFLGIGSGLNCMMLGVEW